LDVRWKNWDFLILTFGGPTQRRKLPLQVGKPKCFFSLIPQYTIFIFEYKAPLGGDSQNQLSLFLDPTGF